MRRACREDVTKLVEISQVCFPDYLEWCTRREAQRWWNSIVESHSCETWLYEKKNVVYGFVRLVVDPLDHQREKAKLRPKVLSLCFVMLTKPRLLKKKLSGKIKRLWRKRPQMDVPGYSLRKSLWLHSIAVQPSMQKRGIGQEIMEFSEKRALELGFDSIKLFINETNRGSIQFHKNIGYLQTGCMDDCLSFIKLL